MDQNAQSGFPGDFPAWVKLAAPPLLMAAVVIGASVFMPAAQPVMAQPANLGSSLTGVMATASDNALNKLSQPGAFYADQAVRIILPGGKGKLLSRGLKIGDKLGLTDKLTKSMNDAAGLAAQEAKPIFRSAIGNLRFNDVPGIIGKNDGATRYLQDSAGGDLRVKIRPLVQSALGKTGALDQLSKLSGSKSSLLGAVGLSSDGLTDSVTDQAMKGIFSYIASEETKLRKNPLGAGKKIIEIIKK